ncbi:Guanine deaminase [Vanrija pseudolonga]|uniref:Guanine deaminase n=1 Tax=Vanrija pseudolonga TaxID=143232 RepID=A0AAF0YAY3_9TREE|nr:Guanine deaminase [Vanrija pseudolonga]
MSKIFRGTFVDTPAPGELRIRLDHVLVVDGRGFISHVRPASDPTIQSLLIAAASAAAGASSNNATAIVTDLPAHTFLLPTFADLHIHAPQYLYAGTGLDQPLMSWLDKYAYAAEERVDADPALAHRVYTQLAKRLIQAGTGCAVAFGTIGVEANLILAQAFQDAGIRGFIGKLSMDNSPRPTYGEASTADSLTSLTSFLNGMDELALPLAAHEQLVHPIITPRFVPVCSDDLLRGIADISRARGVKVQSHMCESRDQMAWVEGTRGKKDEVVFDEAGLLTEHTVQAHVTSFPPSLVELVKKRGVTVAHCPLSNAYFSDAAFPLREAIDAGVKVGLGSDIAGGYALPLQTQMRQAVVVARLREGARREAAFADGTSTAGDEGKGLRVDWVEALYLATRGGKGALGFGGVLEEGMEFDAQQISLAADGAGVGQLDLFDLPAAPDHEWWTESVERWWCNGDDRNRAAVWVQGRKVM